MFKNYFKTAWRNLIRNKAFSLINISGLALGITCSLLIFLWIKDETGIDAFHQNGKQLYQIYERSYYDGKTDAAYPTQGLLAEELKRNIPDIQYASGFEFASAPGTQNTFEAGTKISKMTGMFAGADFFRMFSFPLVQGTAKDAISNPASIAISRAMANHFFGSADKAIGKTIRFDNNEELLVTAVFENIRASSSLQFDFLRSWADFVKQNTWVNNWGSTNPQTFIQLRANANAATVQAKIKHFIYNYQPQSDGLKTELALQPFGDRYLYSNFKDGYIDGGRIEYVHLFSLIAIFILLIACINFMNLATARSVRRAKEVGVRKVIGAVRSSLVWQFIGEALLVTALSVVIALALAAVLIPLFNRFTGKQLLLPFNQPYFWLIITALSLLTSLVAGSYPAFFISSFNPVRVLKGNVKFSWSNLFFRQGLVVLQFTLSILLIISTIIIYQQMNYVQHKNIGYNRDNLIYIPIEGNLVKNYMVFKNEAKSNTSIIDVSKMRNSPTVIEHHTNSISWQGKNPNANVSFADGVVGYDFIKTMNLSLAAERDFSKAFADTTSFILNETAVNKIGLQNPVGRKISWGGVDGTVVGVIKDFHFSSLHQAIDPLIIRLDENWKWGTILVRIKAGETKEALVSLQQICKQLNPNFPFTYRFSDLEFTKLYQSEQVVSKLSDLFAFLAIFISCLGLFGLALFTTEQRNKEIGIRKILGASAKNIISLLSGNFLKPVVIACFIAFPLSWFAMQHWLQNFQYRIGVAWWMFVVAGAAAVGIAFITISFQAIKAAISNPVKSLRTE